MHYKHTWWQLIKIKLMYWINKLLRLIKPSYKIDWQKYIQSTYVLHLEDRVDRKKILLKELKSVKTTRGDLRNEITWWPGIKGENQIDPKIHNPEYTFYYHWSIDPDQQYIWMDEELMKNTMVNCSTAESNIALGHHSILKNIVNSNSDVSLILEDDVVFSHDIVNKLESIFEDQLPKDWEIVYLGALPTGSGFMHEEWSKDLLKLNGGVWWFSGILVSKKGAEKLLNKLPIIGPIDVWINHHLKDLNAYMTKTNIVFQTARTKSDNTYSFVTTFDSNYKK